MASSDQWRQPYDRLPRLIRSIRGHQVGEKLEARKNVIENELSKLKGYEKDGAFGGVNKQQTEAIASLEKKMACLLVRETKRVNYNQKVVREKIEMHAEGIAAKLLEIQKSKVEIECAIDLKKVYSSPISLSLHGGWRKNCAPEFRKLEDLQLEYKMIEPDMKALLGKIASLDNVLRKVEERR
ncbi:hypothetical protein [Variovorax saccharolyticus]|uniref:hypothetical protein n=1 Tax=Variovorax saccharolyticus TaxID=3053516 RepID=UPI002578726E|nr:hypothetical protein [Variovorax sp. J31P216]MDM0029930.1 hypothetical protein [Variovorax sp. J31P216]